MKWTQTTPPNALWTTDQLAYHLRLDPDAAATADEQTYLADLQAAAVEHAEQAMATSLLTRTITATYYQSGGANEQLFLPRGPVVTVAAVTDANGETPTWRLERYGHADLLNVTSAFAWPLTVTYTAGYGSSAANVPADIRQAVRMHVGTLYENRETTSDKASVPVPHGLEAFYANKSRATGMG